MPSSPPDRRVTFSNVVNVRTDFDLLNRLLLGSLNESEAKFLKEFKQYAMKKADAWVLDTKLLDFIGGLLTHDTLQAEIRIRVMRLLSVCALRDDFHNLLQLDRRERFLMSYANRFDDLGVEEQKAVTMFFCNLFSHEKSTDWLFYSSTWSSEEEEEVTSNVKIVGKVAAYSLISYTPSLQDYGSALIFNIAIRETRGLTVQSDKNNESDLPDADLKYGSLSDATLKRTVSSSDTQLVTLKAYKDTLVEICLGILKFIKKTKTPNEEILHRCISALVKFSYVVRLDIKECIVLLDVDMANVRNVSKRIDVLSDLLDERLTTQNGEIVPVSA